MLSSIPASGDRRKSQVFGRGNGRPGAAGIMAPVTLQEAYRVLGLNDAATPEEIKAAYRRLVLGVHPDRGGSPADFIRVRAAYEILSAHHRWAAAEDDVPLPEELREVIEAIVADFRRQADWAEARTAHYLAAFERQLSGYIARATRGELREIGDHFRAAWNAMLVALFSECNDKSEEIIRRYESWFTRSTQAVFDDLYRKELRSFLWRARFWEAFLVTGAVAGALTVLVGWSGPWRVWVSSGMVGAALVVAFFVYRWEALRNRRSRERVTPLSVVPFRMEEGAELPTARTLRRGRRTTAVLGLTGLLAGSAAAGGLAVPVLGAVMGSAMGGALDRLLNPTARVRESMQSDLERFVGAARPQLMTYVAEAHGRLLAEVRGKIVSNYKERVEGAVRLLTAADSPGQRWRLRRRAVDL
jgi:hypothetical protein